METIEHGSFMRVHKKFVEYCLVVTWKTKREKNVNCICTHVHEMLCYL